MDPQAAQETYLEAHRLYETICPPNKDQTRTIRQDEIPEIAARAVILFRRAAAEGNLDAMVALSVCSERPQFHDFISQPEGDQWCRIAAEHGHPEGQFRLGTMYDCGIGDCPENHTIAIDWYTKGAAQNSLGAIYNLAMHYYEGEAIKQDFQRAAELFERSHQLGDVRGSSRLATLYLKGKGVVQDRNKAFQILQTASAEDPTHGGVLFNLARCYHRGYGTNQDLALAACWYEEALKNGHPKAEKMLRTITSL